MTLRGLVNRFLRAVQVLRDEGPAQFGYGVKNRLRLSVGWTTERQKEIYSSLVQVDAEFDGSQRVRTGGTGYLYDLSIVGKNARHGHTYMACDPQRVLDAVVNLDRDLLRYAFVDLGSGKGRVLILAARFPFRSIIGVEFAVEFHLIAQDNLHILTADMRQRITLVNGDAALYQFPPEPLVVFLFNPFDRHLTKKVARNLFESNERNPREIIVVYVNPLFGDEFFALGWEKISELPLTIILRLKS